MSMLLFRYLIVPGGDAGNLSQGAICTLPAWRTRSDTFKPSLHQACITAEPGLEVVLQDLLGNEARSLLGEGRCLRDRKARSVPPTP